MTLTLGPNISFTDTADGRVLLDEQTGHYFHLNRTGSYILEALMAGRDIEQVARALTERFDVSADRATADVAALVNSLRGAKLAEL